MTDLKTKLLEADGGSRELDARIHAWREGAELVSYSTCQHSDREIVVMQKDGVTIDMRLAEIKISRWTTSLDAALALVEEVLPGWTIARIGQDDNKVWWAELRKGFTTSYSRVSGGSHKSPAIALCLALLSALEGEE